MGKTLPKEREELAEMLYVAYVEGHEYHTAWKRLRAFQKKPYRRMADQVLAAGYRQDAKAILHPGLELTRTTFPSNQAQRLTGPRHSPDSAET